MFTGLLLLGTTTCECWSLTTKCPPVSLTLCEINPCLWSLHARSQINCNGQENHSKYLDSGGEPLTRAKCNEHPPCRGDVMHLGPASPKWPVPQGTWGWAPGMTSKLFKRTCTMGRSRLTRGGYSNRTHQHSFCFVRRYLGTTWPRLGDCRAVI